MAALQAHPWPGNVRELANAVRRAASLADGPRLGAADFAFLKPPPASGDRPPLRSIDEHLRLMTETYGGSMELRALAERLGISRKTLWEKKKTWGLP
jgi:DNA-binding NtrC family response regulator